MDCWHRLPGGCRVSSLESSKSCLVVGLGFLFWEPCLNRGWTRWTQRTLPTSTILWFYEIIWISLVDFYFYEPFFSFMWKVLDNIFSSVESWTALSDFWIRALHLTNVSFFFLLSFKTKLWQQKSKQFNCNSLVLVFRCLEDRKSSKKMTWEKWNCRWLTSALLQKV